MKRNAASAWAFPAKAGVDEFELLNQTANPRCWSKEIV
jgi:hypothetical protein